MANQVQFEIISPEKCRITVRNNSENQTCTTEFLITVYDTDDERWEEHATGRYSLGPGDEWSEEFHKYGANNWRHQVFSNECEDYQSNKDRKVQLPDLPQDIKSRIVFPFSSDEKEISSVENCSGNACEKIGISMKQDPNNNAYVKSVTVLNQGPKTVDIEITWGGFFSYCQTSETGSIFPNRTLEFFAPQLISGYCSIKANYQ